MKIVMLGTGHAMVTKCYNTCFAIRDGERSFLVDAGGGNGIMVQLAKAGIGYGSIHYMFVTHAHTDHLLGTIWFVRKVATLMLAGKYEGNLTIFCHDELVRDIGEISRMTMPGNLTQFIGTGADKRIVLREVQSGEQVDGVLGMKLRFFDIASTKAKQFGFRAVLPDGRVLACLGDEPYSETSRSFVEGADWLLSEAFCLYSDRDEFRPYEKHHSTALDAGRLAEELQVKNLLLYHTEDTDLGQRKARYSAEAAGAFLGRVCVPDDLEEIEL